MVTTRSKTAKASGASPRSKLSKQETLVVKVVKAQAKAAAKAASAAAKTAKAIAKAAGKVSKAKAKAKAKSKKSSKKAAKASKKSAKASKKGKRSTAPEPESEDEKENEGSQSESEDEADHKRRRTSDSEGEDIYVQIKNKRRANHKARSLTESITVDIKEWDYSEELPAPKDLKTKIEGELPKIYIGGGAPQPRWLVAQSKAVPLPPSSIGYKRKLSDSSDTGDYGRLVWYLDEGDYKSWGGLEYPQVFELGWKCLDAALQDDEFRNEILQTLADGALPKEVTLDEGWEPTLPSYPPTKYFGLSADAHLWDGSKKPGASGYYYTDHERPTLAVRPSMSAVGPQQHILATKILEQISTGSDAGSDIGSPRKRPMNQSENSQASGYYKGPTPSPAQGNRKSFASTVSSGKASTAGSVASDGSEDEDEQSEPSSASGTEASSPASSESEESQSGSESDSDSGSDGSSHDGLFSADQIEVHYRAKGTNFKQASLGGERKRKLFGSAEGSRDRRKRSRDGPSDEQDLGPAMKMAHEVRRKAEREAAGEISEDDSSFEDEEVVLELRDEVFETAKAMCLDKDARAMFLPNPVAIRGLRMWAGEDLAAGNGPDLTVLPAWADTHRPFHPWIEPPAGAAGRQPPKRNTKPAAKKPEQKPLSDVGFSSF